MITGTQVRMARAALQISVADLAALSGVNKNTISKIENGGDARASTLTALQSGFESRGVRFAMDGSVTPPNQ